MLIKLARKSGRASTMLTFIRRIFPPVSGVFSVGFILFKVGELTKINELIYVALVCGDFYAQNPVR